MTNDDRPRSDDARVTVLHDGYAGADGVASTVSYVVDGEVRIVIDPGMVGSRQRILEPLATAGGDPDAVTDVVFSHHHPDHTLHAALFANARFHDYWAIYHGDAWQSRPAEGFELSPSGVHASVVARRRSARRPSRHRPGRDPPRPCPCARHRRPRRARPRPHLHSGQPHTALTV